jgi:hypothetical protein
MSELQLDKQQVLDYNQFIKKLPSIEILLKKLYAIKTIIEERPQLMGRLNLEGVNKPYDIDVINDIIKNMVKKYSTSLKMYSWPKWNYIDDDKLIDIANTKINADEYNISKFGEEFINVELLRQHVPDMDKGMLEDIEFFHPNAPPGLSPPGRFTNGGKSKKKSKKKSKNNRKKKTNKITNKTKKKTNKKIKNKRKK